MANTGLEILVSYSEFEDARTRFETASNELEDLYNRMNNMIETIASDWNSQAATEYITRIKSEMTVVKNAYMKVESYKDAMQEIQRLYQENESAISNDMSARGLGELSANGIF